jgi:hypothetical protein
MGSPARAGGDSKMSAAIPAESTNARRSVDRIIE